MNRLFLGLAALALAASAALAQVSPPPGGYTIQNKCVVANELCFVVRVGAGGLDATQRVDKLNERLAYILGYERLAPGNIYIRTVNGAPTIYVGRSELFTVTVADAEANGTTPAALAQNWLANLRRALPQARPPVD